MKFILQINQHRMSSFLLCLFFAGFSVNISNACPSMCSCSLLMSKIAINCINKNLKEFPNNMNSNTELMRLGENVITSIPQDFSQKWPNTTTLNMAKNRVTKLQDGLFSNLKHLEEVFLRQNQIRSVGSRIFSGSSPKGTITFSLEKNLVDTVSEYVFKDCTAKIFVYWNSNRIKSLHPLVFKGASSVQYINFDHNRIEILSAGVFEDLSQMYHLGLADNNISAIEAGAFRGLHRVETLTLQKNKLKTLPAAVFKELTIVKDIDLRGNLFSELPVDVLRSLPAFTKVKLRDNPIICTCKLQTLLADAAVQSKIADLDRILCSNVNMSLKTAITSATCISESTARPSSQSLLETTTLSQDRKQGANTSDSTESSGQKPTRVPNLITKNILTEDDYENEPHLPLIIGVSIGAFIIVVVIILFIYLYRRPIAARASNLSLPRKKKNSKSQAYIYTYPGNDYTLDCNI